jgi:hypothetical protein
LTAKAPRTSLLLGASARLAKGSRRLQLLFA